MRISPIRLLAHTAFPLTRNHAYRYPHAMVYPNNPSSPTDLLTALPDHFEAARKSGQLYFFPSTAKDVTSQGRRFNIRSCPALLDKAKAKAEALKAARSDASPDSKRQKTASDDEGPKQNEEEPFKPPYVPELYLGCLEGLEGEEGMSILLNKYAVLPEHMLLCPPNYAPQALPPTPPQLALAHTILLAASRHPTRPRKLLAFYNGGEGAGASQKWRHIQFVEVPGGRSPVEEWVAGVNVSGEEASIVPSVPYLHVLHPLPNVHSLQYPPTTESTERLIDALAPALMKSLDLAFDALRQGGGSKEGGWNLLMTLDHLHLIPRSAPSFPLPSPQEPLELNALGYAGLLLVRSEEEEQVLLSSTEGQGGLTEVLRKCGVPREWGELAMRGRDAQREMIDDLA